MNEIIYVHSFDEVELKALYRLIEKQWIDREDDEIQDIVNRITRIVTHDIPRRDSQAT